jgi:hypothetical protein
MEREIGVYIPPDVLVRAEEGAVEQVEEEGGGHEDGEAEDRERREPRRMAVAIFKAQAGSNEKADGTDTEAKEKGVADVNRRHEEEPGNKDDAERNAKPQKRQPVDPAMKEERKAFISEPRGGRKIKGDQKLDLQLWNDRIGALDHRSQILWRLSNPYRI